jgi:hypothetical protein
MFQKVKLNQTVAETETELVNLHYRNYFLMAFTIYYCQKQVVSSKMICYKIKSIARIIKNMKLIKILTETETELEILHYGYYFSMVFPLYHCQKQVVSSKMICFKIKNNCNNNQKHKTYQNCN